MGGGIGVDHVRKVGARKPVKNRTLQAKQSPEFRNSVPCSDNTCKKAAPCGTGEHGFVKPVQEAFEFGDRLKIGTQVPIEEGGRQRLRAQGPDQGLTFILVAERLEKRKIRLAHRDDPPGSDQEFQGLGASFNKRSIDALLSITGKSYDIELEIFTIIVEVERILRVQDLADRSGIKAKQLGEMLQLRTFASLHVYPKKSSLVELPDMLFVQINLLIVAICVVEKRLHHSRCAVV